MAAIFVCCAATGTDFGTGEKKNNIIWIYFLQDWTPGESLNILMYDISTYTRANVEKTAILRSAWMPVQTIGLINTSNNRIHKTILVISQ